MKFIKTYEECITNVSCSILKYFDLTYKHNTVKEIDDLLDRNHYKNVVVILCDGMGSKILDKHLNKDKFLQKNKVRNLNSVYPATTTAATTSILTGLNPCEHGWLGWDIYVKPIDKIVTMFLNTIKDSEIQAEDYSVCQKYYPFENITERINKNTEYYSKIIFPFGDNCYTDFDNMLEKIIEECNKKNKNYIYAYYENPDELMHEFGTDNKLVKDNINTINEKLQIFSNKLEDTLLIITADHGHINCKPIIIEKNKKIFNLLESDIWLEGRLTSFKVDKKNHAEFVNRFNECYLKDFILMTKEDVISQKLFGDGYETKYFYDSIGDFISLAIGDKYFQYKDDQSFVFKSCHAGITDDEMLIPLILVDKNNNNKN